MLVLALVASAGVSARAQSSLPAGTPPAHPLPARMASSSRLTTVQPPAMLRNVTILRGRSSVEVHIETTNPVKPAVMLLSQPERIVVDLAHVAYDGSRHLPVNAGDVEGVRVALFRANPPVTRVVVDLTHPHKYRLLPAGSTVILAIYTSPDPAIAAATQAAVVPVISTAAAPVVLAPLAKAPTESSEAKLPPSRVASPASAPESPVGHPAPSSSAVAGEPGPPAAPAQAVAESASARLTEPLAPTVSTNMPQIRNSPPTVPASSAQAGDEETTPHQAAKGQKPGVVRGLTVSRAKDAIEVHIEASKPVRAVASSLSNPERIIIDLANVRLDRPRRIVVNAADVQAVSASLYLVNPLVTRVVVNLARPHAYRIQPSGDSLTVRIDTDEMKTAGSQPAR